MCSFNIFLTCFTLAVIINGWGVFLFNNNRVDKEEDRRKIEEIKINEKINELILNEIKKFDK